MEEMIAADHAPRKLTVVSSDHRVQRAAKRRRAIAVDSDVWYEGAVRKRNESSRNRSATRDTGLADAEPPKPFAMPTDAEVQFWLNRVVGEAKLPVNEQSSQEESSPTKSSNERLPNEKLPNEKRTLDWDDIYPADYVDKDADEEES
jgi:hypothetical protein